MAKSVRIGILGCGNMGAALARGLASAGILSAPGDLWLYDVRSEAAEALRTALQASVAARPEDLIAHSDLCVLAVKPQVFQQQPEQFRPASPGKIFVSIMAGISSASLRQALGPDTVAVRAMPNLPLSVGQGVTAIEADGHDEKTLAAVEDLFRSSGATVRVSASHMDAVTALSGSGPMYCFEFLEGLMASGVKLGLSRETAELLALQTLKGSLALLESSHETPSQWTRKVCSPGGTTIHALHELERKGFRGLLMSSVEAAAQRSRELGA